MFRVYVKVYGCKVNQYEAQQLRETFAAAGAQIVDSEDLCDAVVINTCTVTRGSDKEIEYYVRRLKRRMPSRRVYLVGCYVEHYRATLMDHVPSVDAAFDNKQKGQVVRSICDDMRLHGCEDLVPGCSDFSGAGLHPTITAFAERSRAFIKIQDGCDRVCAYCIVRTVRGRSISRSGDDIIKEIEGLVSRGYCEVVLAGIQIGAYGKDCGSSLVSLIERISAVSGLQRIRISSIEPFDVTDQLIDCMSRIPIVCNHLHIAIQSGDTTVLKRMRRGYSRDFLCDRLKTLHTRIPDFAYSVDVIAGFPGESDEAFANTLSLFEQFPPMKIHAFPYSDREGTDAAAFVDKVSEKVKSARVQQLLTCESRCFSQVARAFLGRRMPVFIESSDYDGVGGVWHVHGKLSNYMAVSAVSLSQVNVGQIVMVSIEEVGNLTFRGDVIA